MENKLISMNRTMIVLEIIQFKKNIKNKKELIQILFQLLSKLIEEENGHGIYFFYIILIY